MMMMMIDDGSIRKLDRLGELCSQDVARLLQADEATLFVYNPTTNNKQVGR